MTDAAQTITLFDGTVVSTATGRPVQREKSDDGFVKVPRSQEAVDSIVKLRARLSDLPAPPKQMNVVSAILSYSLMGITDVEIALALSLTIDQIRQIKESQAYASVYERVIDSIIEIDANDIRAMFKRHSAKAIMKIVDVVDNGDDKNALVAAKDILDRAGHRPADVVEHKHSVNGGLKIEYITRKQENIPTIDL